jgi:hypothetical protein
MKILKFKNESQEAARKLLAEARENEPLITKDLKAVAKLNKAKLVGLENRFKEESSLVRKLTNNAEYRKSSIAKESQRNNDTLRYTMIFSPDDYRHYSLQVLTELKQNGYDVLKVWDAWALEGSPDDTGYRGLNVTIISSQNQKFELQFHTKGSFQVKTETHGLYEEFRNRNTSRRRKCEIEAIMKTFATEIKRPKGI